MSNFLEFDVALNERNTDRCWSMTTSATELNSAKYKLNSLSVEITRKCNFQCRHCMRGQAQDVTITPRIIDRLFEQIEDVKGMIGLTGGEVLLEMDMVEYFCNKLIESNWNPAHLQIGTNGTIVSENERLIDLLCKVNKERNINCSIFVSDDIFHAEFDKDNIRFQTLHFFEDELKRRGMDKKIVIGCKKAVDMDDETLSVVLIGNAKQNADTIAKEFETYNRLGHCFEYNNHRIKVAGDTIGCMLSILANGNVSLWQTYDYKTADNNRMGNILYTDFKRIIDDYNTQKAIYQCYEAGNYSYLSKVNLGCHDLSQNGKDYLQLHLFRYERTFSVRKTTRKLFPYLTADEIIKKFPIPSQQDWLTILESMRIASKYKVSGVADIVKMLQDTKADFGRYNLYSANKYRVKQWLQDNMQ